MSARRYGGLLAVVAWVVFPVLPVALENAYSGVLAVNATGFADPRVWDWFVWLIQLGPLVGFGFLAGATVDLPDEPTTSHWTRAWLSRRWFWVAVGPWSGFVVGVAVLWVVSKLLPGGAFAWVPPLLGIAIGVTTICYGWLVFAFAAFRRAKRLGTARASVRRGMAVSSAFVGSLFGSFWAVTEWWRAFYFDPRVVPLLLIAVALATTACGCGPVTYGEVRRRELFHAMLLAWTIGLALIWRWWARTRPGPPG